MAVLAAEDIRLTEQPQWSLRSMSKSHHHVDVPVEIPMRPTGLPFIIMTRLCQAGSESGTMIWVGSLDIDTLENGHLLWVEFLLKSF